ncbi:MAG: TonB-dependent receptor [Paramuribaculum sp.]|nr:TonB-dependent receptor [Paramuribaculum sp.]
MPLRKIICLTIALITSALFLSAEEFTLRGKIIDEEGEPIEGATVKVSPGFAGTMSKANGEYRLTASGTDTVFVSFSCISYRTVTRKLIEPKGELTINIRLHTADKEVGTVEVKEIRKQTSATQRIDTRGYRNHAADPTGGSVESMLATMPGVSGANELSNQYSVRGGSYDENTVYINGFEVYRPQLVSASAQEGLSIINPDLTKSVEFSSGGFGAQYADKMSSVLDVQYKHPQRFEASLNASLMGIEAAVGSSSAKFSQLHGVRYRQNGSILSTTDTKGEYDPDFFDWQSYFIFNPNNRIKITLLGDVNLANYRFEPADRSTNFGTMNDAKKFKVYFDGKEHDKFTSLFGGLGLDYRMSQSTTMALQLSGYKGDELVTYDISGEYWLDQAGADEGAIGGEMGVGKYQDHARDRLKSQIITSSLRGISTIKTHSLTYGITFKSMNMSDNSIGWERRDSAGYSLPVADQLRVFYFSRSDNELSSSQFSAYVQDNIKIDGKYGYFNISAGIRATYTSFNKEFILSPRAQIGYVPAKAPRWAFRFATGLYHQTPFFKEIRKADKLYDGVYELTLNTDIKSQRSLQFVLGADYTFRAFNRPFKLSGEAYYKNLSNIIPYEIDNLKITYSGLNESSGYVTGLDMKLFGEFVPGSESWLTVGVMKSGENLRGITVPVANERRFNLSLFFTDYLPKLPRLKLSLRGVFMDGLIQSAPHSSRDKGYFRTPAYKRVDLGLAYGLLTADRTGNNFKWIKSAWIGVDCFNLFDISNVGNYYWVSDVNNVQYAVPNYLTRRLLNIKLSLEF